MKPRDFASFIEDEGDRRNFMRVMRDKELKEAEEFLLVPLVDIQQCCGFQTSRMARDFYSRVRIAIWSPNVIVRPESLDLTLPDRLRPWIKPDTPLVCLQMGQIVELAGESGAGKTQFALQLCVDFQRVFPAEKVLWIATEGPFQQSRLEEIALETEINAMNFNINRHTMTDADEPSEPLLLRGERFNYSSQIQVVSAIQAEKGEEIQVFETVPLEVYKLIVVDSIAGLFRGIYGAGEAIERGRVIAGIAGHLRYAAAQGSLVLVLNQVTDVMEDGKGEPGADYHDIKRVIPALGTSWAYVPNSRLLLARKILNPQKRILRVLSSNICPQGPEIELTVDKAGIHPPDFNF